MPITEQQLLQVLPNAGRSAGVFVSALNTAMNRYGIVGSARVAGFIAQIGHESGQLRYVREIWGPTAQQACYEGRADLGAFGALQYRLSSFSKLINLATTGAGGMDTGGAPANGFVGIYANYNPSLPLSGTNPALLAQNATSVALGNIYGGANMPAGYTASALLSVWPTNASGQLSPGDQFERTVNTTTIGVLTGGMATIYTPFSLSGAVPLNAKSFNGMITVPGSSASSGFISSRATPLAEKRTGGYTGSGAQAPSSSFNNQPIATAQTSYYYGIASNGIQIQSTGYTF